MKLLSVIKTFVYVRIYMWFIRKYMKPPGSADHNTYHTNSCDVKTVLENLQEALQFFFHWFSTNRFVANAGKCSLLSSTHHNFGAPLTDLSKPLKYLSHDLTYC